MSYRPSVTTGDIFKESYLDNDENEQFKYFLNIRAQCDTLRKSNPDPDELLKLFPSETRSDWHFRVPYHAFFIFFGYYLGNSWTLCYTKNNSYKRYNKISNSKPDSLIERVYKIYVPWLLWRAEVLKTYFENGKYDYRM